MKIEQRAGNNRSSNLSRLAQMAEKEISAIHEIGDVTFNDFMQSRIMRTKSGNASVYLLKIATKVLLSPAYFLAYKMYKTGTEMAYEI